MRAYANQAIGKVKKTVGKATKNRSLQAKGTVQEYAGKTQAGAKRLGRAIRRKTSRPRRNVRKARSRT